MNHLSQGENNPPPFCASFTCFEQHKCNYSAAFLKRSIPSLLHHFSDICQECSLTSMHFARFFFPLFLRDGGKALVADNKILCWFCFAFTSLPQEVGWDPRVTHNSSSGSPLAFNTPSAKLMDRLRSNAFLLFRSKFHPLGIMDLSDGVSGVNFLRV